MVAARSQVRQATFERITTLRDRAPAQFGAPEHQAMLARLARSDRRVGLLLAATLPNQSRAHRRPSIWVDLYSLIAAAAAGVVFLTLILGRNRTPVGWAVAWSVIATLLFRILARRDFRAAVALDSAPYRARFVQRTIIKLLVFCVFVLADAALMRPSSIDPFIALDAVLCAMLVGFGIGPGVTAANLWVRRALAQWTQRNSDGILRVRIPLEYVHAQLLSSVLEIDRGAARWADVTYRRQLIRTLLSVAGVLERDVRWLLLTGDATIDIWTSTRLLEIGAAVRELQRWVVLPMADTPHQLAERLATTLASLLSGHWNSLARGVQETPPFSRPRAVLAAIVPAGLVLALSVAGVWVYRRAVLNHHSDPVALLVSVVVLVAPAALYLLVSLLRAIDPNFEANLAAVKDLRATITSSSTK